MGGGGRARGKIELAQQVRDVPVHGVLAHHQPLRDLPVRQPVGEQAAAPRARAASALPAARGRRRRGEDPPRPPGVELRAQPEQAIQRGGRLALGHLGAAEREQARGKLEPRPRGLERRAAALEAVDRVLEQRASATVVAAGSTRAPPSARSAQAPQRRRADLPLHLRGAPRAPSPPPRTRPAPPAHGRAARAPARGRGRDPPAAAAAAARAGPPLAASLPRSSARRARHRCALEEAPARSSSRSASAGRPCRRRSSAKPTSGPPTHAGRERAKSSTDASSIASASLQRPRHRSTAPYSARQNASM